MFRSSLAVSLVSVAWFGLISGALAQLPASSESPGTPSEETYSKSRRPSAANTPELTFGVGTTLVLVPVSVTDSSNRYVLGLEKKNFRIFEGETEQKISQFSGEDAPISIGIIVDTSGSIGSKLDRSRQAVSEFLKTMNDHDEAFLIMFNQRAKLYTGFTASIKDIEDQLKGVESSGYTALLDAVHMGIDQMKKAKNARKALLIISDGGDNISHYTPRQIADLVREADVEIYAIGVFEPLLFHGMSAEEVGGPQLLADLSQQTGGRIFAAADDSQLPGAAARIGIELRNQYVLAYSPTNRERNGAYRKIQVRLLQPQELPPLKARWRQGYYAPAQ